MTMSNGKTAGKQDNMQKNPTNVMGGMQNQDEDKHNEATEQQQEDTKRAKASTEAEAKSIDGKAGKSNKSSHDHMSNVKAGSHEGAGGGAKQERHH